MCIYVDIGDLLILWEMISTCVLNVMFNKPSWLALQRPSLILVFVDFYLYVSLIFFLILVIVYFFHICVLWLTIVFCDGYLCVSWPDHEMSRFYLFKHYFCGSVRAEEISIWTGGLSKVVVLPSLGGHFLILLRTWI